MCFKKLKNKIDRKITQEKDIQVRERIEKRFERSTGIILVVLFTGNIVAGVKSIYSAIITLIILIVLLGIYILFECYIMINYCKYTDSLIRSVNKKVKKF